MTSPSPRFLFLDVVRGVTVIMMIIFHFFYDLNLFQIVSIDFQNNNFWFYFPRLIVFLFTSCLGMSLVVAHAPQIKWPKFWKRWREVTAGAFAITLITWWFFPERFVYFGTLHCMSFCLLAALPFRNLPRLSLLTGLSFFFSMLIFHIDFHDVSSLIPTRSMDFIPPYPWLGSVLIGQFLGHKKIYAWPISNNIFTRGVQWLGQHSLSIYLLHQPLLYGLIFCYHRLR